MPETLTTQQRLEYQAATRDFVLPAFMIKDVDGWRLVHYEADILSRLPWEEIDVSPLDELVLDEGRAEVGHLRTGLAGEERMRRRWKLTRVPTSDETAML